MHSNMKSSDPSSDGKTVMTMPGGAAGTPPPPQSQPAGTRLGRRVAIKFLHTTDDELTQRFILEARTTASCSHENIVVIHEVGEHAGVPFMVLEYLQGQSLKKVVGGQRVPPERAVELIVPIVRALVCA